MFVSCLCVCVWCFCVSAVYESGRIVALIQMFTFHVQVCVRCDMDKCLLRDAGGCSGSIKCTHIHSPALFGSPVKRRLMHPENRRNDRQRDRDPHGQRRVFHCRYLVHNNYPIPLSLSLSPPPLFMAKGKDENKLSLWSTHHTQLFSRKNAAQGHVSDASHVVGK